ncbi:hypothetical protein D3C73_1286800 [compost metagenome]
MEYVKAADVIPEHLIREIQRYIQGDMIYIPTRCQDRKKWGQTSGAADYYTVRNREIRESFRTGTGIDGLSDQYGLSVESIKKIVYSKK